MNAQEVELFSAQVEKFVQAEPDGAAAMLIEILASDHFFRESIANNFIEEIANFKQAEKAKRYAITYDGFDKSRVSIIEAENVEDALILFKFGNKIDGLEKAKAEWESVKAELVEEVGSKWKSAKIGDFINYEHEGGGEADFPLSAINLDGGGVEWVNGEAPNWFER